MATALAPRNEHASGQLKNVKISTLHHVRPPITARRAAKLVALLFLLTPIALIFVPWQQSLTATGRVIAYDPTYREQVVEAPLTGRIISMNVVEGQEVKGRKLDKDGNVLEEGTLLVTIRDQDPQYLERLKKQRDAFARKIDAARAKVVSYSEQINALKQARTQATQAAKHRFEMAKRRRRAAEQVLLNATAALQLAKYSHKQQKGLLSDGLTAELEYQKAVQKLESSKAEQDRAKASELEAGLSVSAYKADLSKVGFDFDASIRSATASRDSAESEVASNEAALADMDVKIARQGTRDVYAPCDGTVFRIISRGARGGKLVKEGTALMRIVPDIPEEERVVELLVDGNDAPLINELWYEQLQETGKKPKIPVRLQFEGYPAIQWVGWPSAAVGTFGGILDFVDATDDGKGNFRIIVRRDPEEEKFNPWPRGHALRQGLRTNGWVLLNRVSLGWECWRRLNGFPPVVAEERAPKKSKPAVLKGVK